MTFTPPSPCRRAARGRGRSTAQTAVERLESRVHLTMTPMGGELLVSDSEMDCGPVDVASAGYGDAVVAWRQAAADGGASFSPRRYDDIGQALNVPFRVDGGPSSAGEKLGPSVA